MKLSDYLKEPGINDTSEDVLARSINYLKANCPECRSSLEAALSFNPAYAYALLCDRHAPFVRLLTEPEHLTWVRHHLAELEYTHGRLSEVKAIRTRIEKGERLLDAPSLAEAKRSTYEDRILALHKEMNKLLSPTDQDDAQWQEAELDRIHSIMVYYQDWLRRATTPLEDTL